MQCLPVLVRKIARAAGVGRRHGEGAMRHGRHLLSHLLTLSAAAFLLADNVPLLAQSRADEIARQRRRGPKPPRPTFRAAWNASSSPSRANGSSACRGAGIRPCSVTGGGFTGGVGYRHYIGYDSYVDASALYSVANYKQVKLTASTPNHLGDRLDLSGSIAWADADTGPVLRARRRFSQDNRTSFRVNRTQLAGVATLHLVDWLQLALNGVPTTTHSWRGRARFRRSRPSSRRKPRPARADLTYLRGEVSAAALWLASPSAQPPRRSRAARLRGIQSAAGRGRHLRYREPRGRAAYPGAARDVGAVAAWTVRSRWCAPPTSCPTF